MDPLGLLPEDILFLLVCQLDVPSVLALEEASRQLKEVLKRLLQGTDFWNKKAYQLLWFAPRCQCTKNDVIEMTLARQNILKMRFIVRPSPLPHQWSHYSFNNHNFFDIWQVLTPKSCSMTNIQATILSGKTHSLYALTPAPTKATEETEGSETFQLANGTSLDIVPLEEATITMNGTATIVGDVVVFPESQCHYDTRSKKLVRWQTAHENSFEGENITFRSGWVSVAFLPAGVVFVHKREWKLIPWDHLSELDDSHRLELAEQTQVCPTFEHGTVLVHRDGNCLNFWHLDNFPCFTSTVTSGYLIPLLRCSFYRSNAMWMTGRAVGLLTINWLLPLDESLWCGILFLDELLNRNPKALLGLGAETNYSNHYLDNLDLSFEDLPDDCEIKENIGFDYFIYERSVRIPTSVVDSFFPFKILVTDNSEYVIDFVNLL